MFSVGFGLADFSTVPPTTALAKTAFPDGGWALVLGLIGSRTRSGRRSAARSAASLYDATGGYGAFFVGAAATCVAAAVLSLLIGRTPGHRSAPGCGRPRAPPPAPRSPSGDTARAGAPGRDGKDPR